MKHHRLAAPFAASVLVLVSLLATAGVVFACEPPTISIGTCTANGTGVYHNWILTPELPYVTIEYSTTSAGVAHGQ